MAKTALYTISVRVHPEILKQIEQYQEKNNIDTKSECLNKALELLLNPQNPDKNTAEDLIKNPELIDKLAEQVFQKFQNQTFTITKK